MTLIPLYRVGTNDEYHDSFTQDDFPMDDDDLEEMMNLTPVSLLSAVSCDGPFHLGCNSSSNPDDGLRLSPKSSSSKDMHSILRSGMKIPVSAETSLEAFQFPILPTHSDPSSSITFIGSTYSNVDTLRESEGDISEEANYLDEKNLEENFLDDEDVNWLELDLQISNYLEDYTTDPPGPDTPCAELEPRLPILVNAGYWSPSTDTLSEDSSSLTSAHSPDKTLQSVHESSITANHKPFVRPPLPKPLGDNSPIRGLSSSPLLATCFRIAEALNATTIGNRTSNTTFIELYARVTASYRKGHKQFFEFEDLFAASKVPILKGVWVGWKGQEYWEEDGTGFLQGKRKMCRVVGRCQLESNKEWRMVVLSIWEASWDDLEWVKGIVFS